ncbi:MAG: glycosyltransferase family 39 protein [Rhodocyclales bacterium]|nr:glycosyltransferase family 39 protein [Rhodocyclales bacterium]
MPPAIARLLPLLLPLLLLLPNLGGAPLFDIDEGAFSEATREMLAKGDYLSTWLNGNPRFDKPILIYWLQAISVSIFGVVDWAFRVPSALAAAFWCYAVSRFAREFIDEEAGKLAGIVALTCLGVQLIGRAATADALLNLLLTLTITDIWRYIARENAWAGRRAFLWMGLGILTKGPIAVLVPGATLFLWCLTSRRWAPLGKALKDPLSWLLLIGSALPWYIAAYLIHGQAFIDGFFLKHNVQRFSGTLEGHGGSYYYYLLIVPLMLLPWLPWLGKALAGIREDWQNPVRRFLWLWSGFVIAFFSLSGTKLPHYALYGCTPLFILIASRHNRLRNPLAGLPLLVLLGLYAAVPFILPQLNVRDAFYAAQLARFGSDVQPLGGIWPGIAAIVVATLALMLWQVQVWQRVALGALLGNLVLSLWLAPLFGDLLQGPVKRSGLIAHSMGEPVVQWNAHWPSFSVYLQAETMIREPKPGELAITRSDRLPKDAQVDVLRKEGGVMLVRRK